MNISGARPRFGWLHVLSLGAVIVLGAVLIGTAAAAPTRGDIDPVRGDLDTADHATEWGPLSQYDRNLLINVKWANLWEGPTSQQIADRSTNPKVQAVATQLGQEHHALDAAVAEVAERVGVSLPEQANPLQQGWTRDILGRSGSDADTVWANITRRAHGSVFMLIAQVRAQTRNDAIRSFAQRADETVMRHMTLLESTGLVRLDSLYVGSIEAAPRQPVPSHRELLVGGLAALIAALLTVVAVRAFARYEPRTSTE